MQVTSQRLIEQEIMKENFNRFILAYSSPLLQDATAQDLGFSSEDQINKNMLLNRTFLETSDERLKDLTRLFHNSLHMKMHPFVTVFQWNAH